MSFAFSLLWYSFIIKNWELLHSNLLIQKCALCISVSLYLLSSILCLFKLDPLQHIWETSCSVTDPVFSYHSSNSVRHISFYLASLYCILQILSFYRLKFCKHFVASNSVGTIFPIVPAHFGSLYHILPILAVFQSFSLLLYLLRWSVISDLWCCYYNWGGVWTRSHTHVRQRT